MADLLGQLFAYTEVFDMQTRPELILLQKSMVIVEGVARSFDPSLNLWTAAEPVAKEWIEENLGARGYLKQAGDGAITMGRVLQELPSVLLEAERASAGLIDMARNGVRLDEATVARLADETARRDRSLKAAAWVVALSVAAMAAKYFGIL